MHGAQSLAERDPWWQRWRRALARRRLPVVLQMNAVECGAACLAMILSHYGRKARLADVRESCAAGRDGLSAQTIADAARRHGLRVRAYSAQPGDFRDVPLPAIVHWNFNHFVVVESWSPRHVDIVDPAAGRRRLRPAEFDAGFTGVVLTFEPGTGFAPSRHPSRSSWMRHLLQYVGRTPGLLAQILAASLFLQLLGLALPLATKVLVDQVLPFRLTSLMQVLGLGMLILVLAYAVLHWLRAALLLFVQARLDSRMMLGFFEHLLRLPFEFFQRRTSGDLLMRLASNVIIRETLTSQSVALLLDGTFVLVYLAILISTAPLFGFLALALGAAQVMLLLGTTRRVRALLQRDLIAQSASQSYLVEALNGIGTIKASGAEDRVFDRWSNLFFRQLEVSLARSQLDAVVETLMTALRVLSPLLLLWLGALRVLDGGMSLGTMLALNALAVAFLTPLASLVLNGQRLQTVGAHLERIFDVLQSEPEQGPESARPMPALEGGIELRGVTFRYDPQAPLVLRDVSFRVEPGQKVAIVGRTGSGKSTLARLLLGLHAPFEGDILFDGVPLHELDPRGLRRQFGVVLQDPFVFSGSIRQNISFDDPALSLQDVIEAARLAVVHDDIEVMPMGYETRVAEGGTALSGGQVQRLSIARALAHRPAILLLDEATSHLDAVTEAEVDRNLSRLSCTRIVIAHRLSTIQNADLIVVLEHGALVERGTHGELLALGGRYANLVQGQVRAAAAEP